MLSRLKRFTRPNNVNFARSNVNFRKICSSTMNSRIRGVYQDAITLSNDDPEITPEDLINKAFAYLTFTEKDGTMGYVWNAQECLEIAKKMDSKGEFKKDIQCGLRQIENKKVSCFHTVGDMV